MSKNIGRDGLLDSGADAGDYLVTDQATTTADITPRSITVDNVPGTGTGCGARGGGGTPLTKTYDGTTNVQIDTSGVTISPGAGRQCRLLGHRHDRGQERCHRPPYWSHSVIGR